MMFVTRPDIPHVSIFVDIRMQTMHTVRLLYLIILYLKAGFVCF